MADTYKPCRTELEVGRRADFRVHYIREVRGQRRAYFDAIWAPTEDAARSRFLAAAKEVGWRGVEITKTVAVPKLEG